MLIPVQETQTHTVGEKESERARAFRTLPKNIWSFAALPALALRCCALLQQCMCVCVCLYLCPTPVVKKFVFVIFAVGVNAKLSKARRRRRCRCLCLLLHTFRVATENTRKFSSLCMCVCLN